MNFKPVLHDVFMEPYNQSNITLDANPLFCTYKTTILYLENTTVLQKKNYLSPKRDNVAQFIL